MTTVDRSHTRPAIPRPRTPQDDGPVVLREAATVGEYPWPEPWRYSRAARPRSEFWDVTTASRHSRGPYPRER